MSFPVVIYAEGPGELAGESTQLPAPGEEIAEDDLGAVHVLTRRLVCEVKALPENAVRFVAPLRTATGRVARGSDLLAHANLRRLLSWPREDRRPALAVVLVDEDGHAAREGFLRTAAEGAKLTTAVGVAIREFESWLIVDESAVASVTGRAFAQTASPETMGRKTARELLQQALHDSPNRDQADRAWTRKARRSIASLLDPDLVARRCPAFHRFRGAF